MIANKNAVKNDTTKRKNPHVELLKTYSKFSLKKERKQVEVMKRLTKKSQDRISLLQADDPKIAAKQGMDQAKQLIIKKLQEYEIHRRKRNKELANVNIITGCSEF